MDSAILQRRRGVAAWITARELDAWMSEGRRFALIDVREAAAFEAGHLTGAINCPDSNTTALVRRIPQDEFTVLVCADGQLSHLIARTLDYCGYSRVVYMEGGLKAWAGAHGTAPNPPAAARSTSQTPARERDVTGALLLASRALNARVLATALLGAAAFISIALLLWLR